nr:MAG TPA: hypothetical protein [Caudoviricetes sp.]
MCQAYFFGLCKFEPDAPDPFYASLFLAYPIYAS